MNVAERRAEFARLRRSSQFRQQLDRRVDACGRRCVYCEGPFETVDHVVPLKKGGTNELANLVSCCFRCNTRKQAQDVDVFIGRLWIYRQERWWESLSEDARRAEMVRAVRVLDNFRFAEAA